MKSRNTFHRHSIILDSENIRASVEALASLIVEDKCDLIISDNSIVVKSTSRIFTISSFSSCAGCCYTKADLFDVE